MATLNFFKRKAVPYLVNKGETSNSWFREYSDGWVEQGGYFSADKATEVVSLARPFVNENYCLVINGNIVGTANGNFGFSAKTNSTFSILNAYNAKGFDWFACGFS